MKRNLLFILFTMATLVAFSQDITGDWNGSLNVQNNAIPLVFHINKTDAGYSATMDSPVQGAKGIIMSHVTFENPKLIIELRIAQINYTGTLEKNTLTGTFTQAGQSMPLNLTKSDAKIVKKEELSIDKNAPFIETPITLKTPTGKIFGTLTTPKTFKKGPLALIIAGSGPTDRNCNNPMMTCDAYKKLAYELAKNNIASLRYDKRGIAESAAAVENESDLLFEDYVTDAKAWIQLAKQDKRFTQIVVIGHSEGSLIGMLAATKADKFVSVAGSGRSAAILLKEQLKSQPQEIQDLSFPIVDSLVLGKKVENINPMMSSIFRSSVQSYLISWFRYNPQTELNKLSIPILIVQGTSDIQVSVADAKLLSAAQPQSKLILIDGMNHILRKVEGDRAANLATYNQAELPLDEVFVKSLCDFINSPN